VLDLFRNGIGEAMNGKMNNKDEHAMNRKMNKP
jgi:hypothetical protein